MKMTKIGIKFPDHKSTWLTYGVGAQADENVAERAEHILALLGDEVLDE